MAGFWGLQIRETSHVVQQVWGRTQRWGTFTVKASLSFFKKCFEFIGSRRAPREAVYDQAAVLPCIFLCCLVLYLYGIGLLLPNFLLINLPCQISFQAELDCTFATEPMLCVP